MGDGLKLIAEAWHGCTRCGLAKERSGLRIVFGTGLVTARYLLVYETPTEADAAAGLPMIGHEGDLLVALLERAGIDPKEVYCTPMLGCRPTAVLPATDDQPARVVDRAPAAEEVKACAPRLRDIIYVVDPRIIFTLGPGPFLHLVRGPDRGKTTSLESAIGKLYVTRIPGRWVPEIRYDVIPLMSMPQIMAKPSHAPHGPLAVTAEHLRKGRAYASFLEKTGNRDRAATGFDEAQ